MRLSFFFVLFFSPKVFLFAKPSQKVLCFENLLEKKSWKGFRLKSDLKEKRTYLIGRKKQFLEKKGKLILTDEALKWRIISSPQEVYTYEKGVLSKKMQLISGRFITQPVSSDELQQWNHFFQIFNPHQLKKTFFLTKCEEKEGQIFLSLHPKKAHHSLKKLDAVFGKKGLPKKLSFSFLNQSQTDLFFENSLYALKRNSSK